MRTTGPDTSDDGLLSRYRGSLLGLATGDALGTTVEFSPPGSFEPLKDIVGGGPFQLPVGAWTDDTSMALCLAESLVHRREFDPVDQLARYVWWWEEGHLSSTGRCFDIGSATRTSLTDYLETGKPYPGDNFPEAGGNGTLMRLAPVPLAWAREPATAIELSGKSARTTHGMRQGIDACRYFGGLIVGAVGGVSKDELIGGEPFHPTGGRWDGELHPETLDVASGSFRKKSPPDIRGAGYVTAALEAALWALATTGDFEQGALAAVNLGDDADTTGAIYGQLAGAIYGVEGIPESWREKIVMREEIETMADRLLDLSESIPQ